MKILLALILLFSFSAFAGKKFHPQYVITNMIKDVQDNDEAGLKIWVDFEVLASHKKHAMTKETLIKSFKEVKDPTFKLVLHEKGKSIVRMLTPLSLDFELKDYCNENLRGTSKVACQLKIIKISP